MNTNKTILARNEIDGEIASFEDFWSPVQIGVNIPGFNNFFAFFQDGTIKNNFIPFLNKDPKNFSSQSIDKYIRNIVASSRIFSRRMREEQIQEWVIRYISFAEYYRAFPDEVEKLFEISSQFESLSSEISKYVAGNVSNLVKDDYPRRLYEAYAYMRTQPGSWDSMLAK